MSLIEYYEREIRYFLEEAHRFADAHQDQARALNLENVRERDPYAERLIEAFAFLAGSVNKRIDDDFAGLAQELLQLIWPHYLHPLPASVIMEVSPALPADESSVEIEKGAVIESGPVSSGLPCKFVTCGDLLIRPFHLRDAGIKSLGDGRSALRLELSPAPGGAKWEDMDRSPLKLYLHGEPGFAFSLYYLLLTDVASVSVQWLENDAPKKRVLSSEVVMPAVFADGQDVPLLPYPDRSFPGFRLLEEYFFLSDKFRFIHADIFSQMSNPDALSPVTIDFILSGREDWRMDPEPSNFRLNCIPAVNLFESPAEPLAVDGGRAEYRLEVNRQHPDHFTPHHVVDIKSLVMRTGERKTYHEFISHRHETDGDSDGYWHVSRRLGVTDKQELFFTLVRRDDEPDETVSIKVMCGNDPVVGEIRLGDIRHISMGMPAFVEAKNLTAPAGPAWPSCEGRELWALINAVGLNRLSITDAQSVKKLLILYDRMNSRSNRRRIKGITSVSTRAADRILRGYPLRGVAADMVMQSENFINRGDLLMFSQILSKFMSMYVSINSFCSLSVKEAETGVIHKFPILYGEKPIL